jgi:anaerobic nitric oxide reductase flavorubredoxin
MEALKIAEGTYRLSANIGSKDLFEGIWPIPNGVSLNAYLVQGEKTALIDLVKDWDDAPASIGKQLSSLSIGYEDIDYLVLNHMEPDHTGWLRELRQRNPGLEIYASKKAVPLVAAFYGIEDGVQAVGSGDSLDLGGGKVLEFFDAPNIHWPETIVTYESSTGVLFSCDAFGSFGQVREDGAFDDQLTEEEHRFFEEESLRYYANIVSTFSAFVLRAIDALSDVDIRIIAPSHGIIWRKNPKTIIDRYVKYASYLKGPAERRITVIWSSMYGNTESLLSSVLKGIEEEGVPVDVHRVPQTHVSYVLASAWRSKGLVFGMPTYEYRMFPPMAHVLDIFDRSHVNNRKVFRFGSYGWSGGAQKQFKERTDGMKLQCIEPVEWQGAPGPEEQALAVERGRELARLVKSDE